MFNSDARQDEFVANLLEFSERGYYLDIGSCGSQSCNNSFFFDNHLRWKGICIEKESGYIDSYSERKSCKLINQDVLSIDLTEELRKECFPYYIDYVSLDVDTLSTEVLERFVKSEYFKFKVLTIEHDAYLYGDQYRQRQRECLNDKGYDLICSDVLVEQSGYGPNLPFEDWWINPLFFTNDLLTKIRSNFEYPSKIIKKFT